MRRPRAFALGFSAALLFLFCLWMCAQIPYTHDDWDWGTANGLVYLTTAVQNSRYAGNLTEVLLTRLPWLKTLVMAAVMTALPLAGTAVLSRLPSGESPESPRRKPLLFWFFSMEYLLLPRVIWQETCSWVAGFSNYTISGLLLLVYLLLVLNTEQAPKPTARILRALLYFFFGLVIQLFLENLTLYLTLLSLLLVCAAAVRGRRLPDTRLLCLFAGNLLGCLLMFSSRMYGALFSQGTALEGLRAFTFDPDAGLFAVAGQILRFFLLSFPAGLWRCNFFFCCMLLVFLAWLSVGCRPIPWAFLLADAAFVLFFLHSRLQSDWAELYNFFFNRSRPLTACLFWLFFFFVAGQVFRLFPGERFRRKLLLFCWFSAPAIVAPMAAVTGLGGRSFFSSFVFLSLFCAALFDAVWTSLRRPWLRRLGVGLLSLLLAFAFLRLGLVYRDIGKAEQVRQAQYALARSGQLQRLELAPYPHGKQYLSSPTPAQDGPYVGFFRDFYRIPEDVEIHFADWS